MTPKDPLDASVRRLLDASKPAADAQAAVDKIGAQNVRNLLDAGERAAQMQSAAKTYSLLPPHTSLIQAEAVRKAAESFASVGKVQIPQSLLVSLAAANRPQMEAIRKALADITSVRRVEVPPSLLDSLVKGAGPQLGTARAASLAQQASALAQPTFQPATSLLESLTEGVTERPYLAELESVETELIPAHELAPTDYEELEIGPPVLLEEMANVLREQSEAGEARAVQFFEVLATITEALQTANQALSDTNVALSAANAKAEAAEERTHAAEKSQEDALKVARSSRFWTVVIGIAAVVASVLIAVLSNGGG